MAVRRRARRRSTRNKSFNLNLIETSAGLALLDQMNAGSAVKQALDGNLQGSLSTLSSAFRDNKKEMVAVGAGALAAKLIVRSVSGNSAVIGAIGPLKLKA